jgi:hypothetical protein
MSFRPKQFQTTRVIDSLIRSDYKQERTITKTKGGKKRTTNKVEITSANYADSAPSCTIIILV